MKSSLRLQSVFAVLLIITFLVSVFVPLNVNTASAATVSINKKNATISQGDTLQLKISGTKSKVIWSTNNKKIATVTSTGKVYGVKSGTAFITAKLGNKSYTCRVLVAFPTLEKSQFTLKYNKKKQIIIRNLPKQFNENDIKWISDNPDVVFVDTKGNVTALAEGYANIRVVFGKTTLRCSIKVPVLNDQEKQEKQKEDQVKYQDFMSKLDYEHGEFNNKEVYIIKNNITSVKVDYQLEFYDLNDNLISVSTQGYMQLPKGKEKIIYIDKPEKDYKYYKFRYNNIRAMENSNTIEDISDKINVSTSELYDYRYTYYGNISDTVKLFDLVVNNQSNNRISFSADVIFYKDNKIVNIKNFMMNSLDVGTTIIKSSDLQLPFKIYSPEYDNYRVIYNIK